MRRMIAVMSVGMVTMLGCGNDPALVLLEPGTKAVVHSADGSPVEPIESYGMDGPIPAGTAVVVEADSASPKAKDGARTALDDPARDVVVAITEGEGEGKAALLRRSDVRPVD